MKRKIALTFSTTLAITWILVVALLLSHNAYPWLKRGVTLDTDILALLPVQERDPVLQQSFSHMVDTAQQSMVVLIGSRDWEHSKQAAQAYRASLTAQANLFEVNQIDGQTQDDWLQIFQKSRMHLLSKTQAKQIQNDTPEQWAELALNKLYAAFSGPKISRFQDDPFSNFDNWVQERAEETPVRPRESFLYVEDQGLHYVLLPIRLIPPAFSITTQEAVMPRLQLAEAAAKNAAADIDIISSGVVLHAAAAGQQASAEISTIGVGSLLGIVLLMWLSFRSFKPMSLILLSLAVGFLGALSVSLLLFEHIHLMTLVFGASLIGIAQDYGLYFLCQRLNEDGSELQLDSHQLLKQLMPGLLLTLLTTVIGYLGLGFTPFPGLRQMAVFSGIGLLFAWCTVLCWFPYLLKKNQLKRGHFLPAYEGLFQTLQSRFLLGLPRKMMFALLLAVLCIAGLSQLNVNDDIRLLQTPNAHLVQDQIKLSRMLKMPSPVQYFLVRGASAEIVLQREENLKLALEAYGTQQQRILPVQAVSNWVPSLKMQAEYRRLIEEKLLTESGPLKLVAEKLGEDKTWPQQIAQNIRASNLDLTVDSFFQSKASAASRHLWLGEINHEYASIVALTGLKNTEFTQMAQIANTLEGTQWVDKVGEISSVLGRYRQNMGWILFAAYFIVFALMFPRYRKDTWRALLPSAVASLIALALLGIFGQALQLFHVLALMLLLGVGVDYGIFMQEQCKMETSKSPRAHLQVAWLATGLSAASTLLSFGLLALSHTPALRAFGLTMLLGTSLVWLITPIFTQRAAHE